MAEDTQKSAGPFDVKTIRSLVSLMSQHELSEIDLQDGDLRIRLRRGSKHSEAAAPAASTWAPPAQPQQAPSPEKDGADKAAGSSKNYHEIKSPTPGTFYAKPSPDAEPFVKPGDRVNTSKVVCLVEAMKIFNEIQAECDGVIKEIVAEDGKPVEYGQVLFLVDTST